MISSGIRSKGIVSINEAKKIIEETGSLTSAINTSNVYNGDYKHYARKKEVNIKILSTEDNNMIIRNMPLLDDKDLKELKMMQAEAKYMHIGCITVSIEPLIHARFLDRYGKSIRGICALIDTTFQDLDQSIISLHRFDLTQKRADYVCFPNHCLSLTDANLRERLSLLICMDEILVKPGNELFNICIGHIMTATNTLNPNKIGTNMMSVELMGSKEVSVEDVSDLLQNTIQSQNEGKTYNLEPSGEDTYIERKKQGWLAPFKPKPKIVMRKNYTVNENSSSSNMIKLPTLGADPRWNFTSNQNFTSKNWSGQIANTKMKVQGEKNVPSHRKSISFDDTDINILTSELNGSSAEIDACDNLNFEKNYTSEEIPKPVPFSEPSIGSMIPNEETIKDAIRKVKINRMRKINRQSAEI